MQGNILFVSHLSERTGAPVVLIFIASHLNKEKFRSTIILPESGPIVAEIQRQNLPYKIIATPTISLLETKSLLIKLQLLAKRIKYTWQLLKEIKSGGYHLVYINSAVNIFPGLSARLAGSKILWHIHDVLVPSLFTQIKTRLIKWLSNAVIFVDPSVAQHFRPQPRAQPWFIVPNLIDVNRFWDYKNTDIVKKDFDLSEDDRVLLTVGNVTNRKGIDVLLGALGLLIPTFPHLKLLIAGDYENVPANYKALIDKIMERQNLKNHVCFLGVRDDVEKLLALCNVFVLASRHEVLPYSLIEAMAAKRPIVATDVGGVKNMLDQGECGLVVAPENPEALAQAIAKLLAEPTTANSLAEKAFQKASTEYAYPRIISRLEEIIDYVLSQR